MRRRFAVPLALLGAGVATIGYSVGYERTRWTLRRFDVPVLAKGSAPIRLLHLSDVHMTPGQLGKQKWIRSLDALDPHLVAVTGDNLAHRGATAAIMDSLGPLLDRPGAFVFGSNDYYGPLPKNPLRYFNPDHKRVAGPPLPWQDLRAGLVTRGWQDLSNARGSLTVDGHRIDLRGVDDPHLRRDRYDDVAGLGTSPYYPFRFACPPEATLLTLVAADRPR